MGNYRESGEVLFMKNGISTSVLMLTNISQSKRFYFYKTSPLNLYINNAILDTL